MGCVLFGTSFILEVETLPIWIEGENVTGIHYMYLTSAELQGLIRWRILSTWKASSHPNYDVCHNCLNSLNSFLDIAEFSSQSQMLR